MRDARFPERTLAELMKSTRRRLAEEVIKLREQASHPYITRLEQENAALLAEVERLRAREAALLAVVTAVAKAYQPTKYSYGSVSCRTVEQARALLEDTKNGG